MTLKYLLDLVNVFAILIFYTKQTYISVLNVFELCFAQSLFVCHTNLFPLHIAASNIKPKLNAFPAPMDSEDISFTSPTFKALWKGLFT